MLQEATKEATKYIDAKASKWARISKEKMVISW
jgi:hypothetical protein